MKSKYREFLDEDIGSGDITSKLVIPADARAQGRIIAKQDCVLAGASEASEVFKELGAKVVKAGRDGGHVKKGDAVLEVRGSARAILAGERLALNFIMRMSGIATLTNDLVRRCKKINPDVRIAATRKTTPGFRAFEKKAVLLGGGDPHRYGLDDAILIKDNHIRIAGGVREALARAKKGGHAKKVEIEVENAKDAHIALENGADIIMLDNFSPEEARKLSSELKREKPEVMIEVSGGVRPDNIEEYASCADIISLGWLTHSYRSADFSMVLDKA
ncbi:MAG: carboxylating nicotinate-nucleotide diphosphorylase [Thermoplasmata archaeon]